MNLPRLATIAVLSCSALSRADVTDPGPVWLFPAQTNVQGHWRPGLGLPGQAAPERPLVDLATQGVTVTSLGIRTWTDRVKVPELSATQQHTSFWTETLVPLPSGGLLGFDAYDLREGLSAKGPDGRRETFESPSGIRFGAAWDLLHPFDPTHWASLGLEGWLPAWSVGETSLRSSLRLGTSFRADAGVGWRRSGIRAKQDTGLNAWSDTLEPGCLQRVLDVRVAGRIDSMQIQAWGGWRTLDPRGDSAAWRRWGDILFVGGQVQGRILGLSLELEGRGEQGQESMETLRLGGKVASRIERTSVSGSLRLEPAEIQVFGQPRLTVEFSRLDLDETSFQHPESLGVAAMAGARVPAGGGAVERLGLIGQLPFFWSAFRLAPELGWHRIERRGELPALWTGGLGALEVGGGMRVEEVWVPGIQVTWKRSGSLWNYRLTRAMDGDAVQRGWHHDILLSQSF